MTTLSFSLDADVVTWLDAEARRRGTSRSRLVNTLIHSAMREEALLSRFEARLRAVEEKLERALNGCGQPLS